jgi:hypothetical protein
MRRRFVKKKSYGEYKVITCPFCERTATQKTEEGLEVCHKHTTSKLEIIRCTCGKLLEQRSGKFGPYFNCINCGNFNFNKAMEIKAITKLKANSSPNSSQFVSNMTFKENQTEIKKKTIIKPKKVETLEEYKKKFRSFNFEEEDNPKETTISSRDVDYF